MNRLVITLENELGGAVAEPHHPPGIAYGQWDGVLRPRKVDPSDLAEAERDLGDTGRDAVGRLRVNAPMSFGIMHLGKAVADFMARHPT